MTHNVTQEMIDSLKEGTTHTINTTYSDTIQHNGKQAKIVTVYDKPDGKHDEEALPMYEVEIEGSKNIELFPEEFFA